LHGHVLILAGDGDHMGYACALAPVLHEKVPLFFLVPEENVLSERGPREFGEVDSLIESKGPRVLPSTKKSLKVLKNV